MNLFNSLRIYLYYSLFSTTFFVFGQRCSYTCGSGCPTIPLTAGSHTVVYCTPGTCTFTVPSYVNSISVEVYGAGGGGGGVWSRSDTDHSWGSDACAGGGGGGGGGFSYKSFSVTAGQNYTVIVGAGGAGGTAASMSSAGVNTNSGTPGGTGGTSSFSGNGENIIATGGTGGNSAAARRNSNDYSQYSQAPGGVGGTGSGGSVAYTGGRGSFGYPNGSRDHSSAGGGCAGNNGNGNIPRVTFSGNIANNAANTAPNTENERRISGQGGVCFSSTAGNGGDGISRMANNGANTGNAGTHVGGGGAGALSHNHGSSAVSATGGAGANGMVVVTFFSTLGVNLSDFNVSCNDNNQTIYWKTLKEINSSHFLVERSRDGVNWQEIERIEGAGNSNQIREYNVVDNYHSLSDVYYRLIQVDYDGVRTIYGPLVSTCTSAASMIAYPNPANDKFIIEIKSDVDYSGSILVSDINGKIIYETDCTIKKGISTSYVDCSTYDAGVYFISIISNEGNNPFKPIKLIVE